ncbi:hypothetical protein BKP64_01830 [Marinobacter salinus]|uniref:Uncharacterized protein n=1 Tax=Marinobacter salinus TaxID=1874317 RepID=A0A1D9GH97_9GAMM|nr:hypothetical protein BKP64_01830 [Marinobacter salinus]
MHRNASEGTAELSAISTGVALGRTDPADFFGKSAKKMELLPLFHVKTVFCLYLFGSKGRDV